MRPPRWICTLVATVLGLLLVGACSFDGAYDLPLPGGRAVDPDDAITITADFTDALNVVPRTAVMVDDVPVGQVSETDRVGWTARVTLQIRKDLVLPANTTAEIRQTSLLGEKYVALIAPENGATGRLRDGAHIGLDKTAHNPEVEDVLGALSFVLSGGGVEQLRTISVEINKMLDGRTADARGALENINVLVGGLDGQKQSIVNAMDAVDSLARTLNKEKQAVGAAIDAIGPALRVLNDQHRALVRMLSDLDRLGVVGTRVLRASKDDVVAVLRHLQPTLKGLADAGESLPRGLSLMASFPFPKEAANLAMGDYANAFFALDFDLSKLIGASNAANQIPQSSNLPSPLDLCMATPAAPLCSTLSTTVLARLCALMPTNPLCPARGPGANGNPRNPLTGLLGGLLGGAPATPPTPKPAGSAPPVHNGVLWDLVSLLGGDR